MARLLVTGGAGFIGANFVRGWRQRHADDVIVVIDALTYAGDRANLDGVAAIEFVHGDIRDEDRVLSLLRDRSLDTVVHFAAETHVDRSIDGPDAFIEANVVGTHALLKAARKAWLDTGGGRPHRFHHVSTDEVYGSLGADEPAATEASPYRPSSPYAASKAASDHLVRAYARTYGLETTISHCSNNYGPYQFPEKLIPFFLLRALQGQPLPLYGDGRQIRDWLHVGDHCRGIGQILERGQPGESYNLAGGHEHTNIAIVETLCRLLDAAFREDPGLSARFPQAPPARGRSCAELVVHVADRLGHDRRYALNSLKANNDLGFCAPVGVEAGLIWTIGWYLRPPA